MFGIWHECDWLKRDLAPPIYGQVECGSPISSWFITFINEKYIHLIFMCKGNDVFMDLMADMFIVFMFLLCFFLYAHLPRRLLQSVLEHGSNTWIGWALS